MIRTLCALVLLPVPACGDGELDLPGGSGCAAGVSFVDVDILGVWHVYASFDPTSSSVAVLRIEDGAGEPRAAVWGQDGGVVEHRDGRLTVSFAFTDDGSSRSWTFDFCDYHDDGTAVGALEVCVDGACYPAQAQARKLAPLDEPVAENVTVVSEYGGPPSGAWRQDGHITVNVRVHEGMAYLARYRDGLRIVDITDPTRPRARGHVPVQAPGDEIYNDVKVAERADGRVFALLASNLHGVVVVDVSDPDSPVAVTRFPGAVDAPDGVPAVHTLFVEGPRAYVAYNFDQTLRIYDITDPAQPQPLGAFVHPRAGTEGGYLHDLYVEDGRAYLNYWNLGMAIVDTADDPQNPTLIGEYDDYGDGPGDDASHSTWVTRVAGRTVAVHGDEGYGAHTRVVDVDPESPAFLDTLASYQLRPEVSVHNILAHGQRAFVTHYQDGLRILDLGDPTRPVEIGHFHTWPGIEPGYGESFFEGALGVDYDPISDTLYLADTHRGLFILRPE